MSSPEKQSPLSSSLRTFGGGEIQVPTKEGILSWLLEAKTNGASHVVVVCDTFDYEDYPVEVLPDEDVHAVVAKNNNPDHMSNVMEVYWLDGDIDAQLAMPSSFTYGPAEPGSQD